MAWIIPYNKLDVQQRYFLDSVDINQKNIWIKGFAGSGKSILLVYAARKICETPSVRILLIVFTWSMVEMYKAAFKEMGLNVPIKTYYSFMNDNNRYDYILCDEVQDLTPTVIQEMKNRGTHIIVAGDSNQSIYDRDPRNGDQTVKPSVIGQLIKGETFELGIIHRLSRSIIDAVQRLLPQMNIFSSKKDMTKNDTQIRLCHALSEEEEVKYVMEQATKAVNHGYTAAVLIPTIQGIIDFANQVLLNIGKPVWTETKNRYGKSDLSSLNLHLQNNGVKIQHVGNGHGCFSENDRRVIVMTFHSAKGLDFDNVFIPFANNNMYIHPNTDMARTLFMVAMTRTRENLYISYCGNSSNFLNAFQSNCSHINISTSTINQKINNNSTWGF